jgi:hypothetical protein
LLAQELGDVSDQYVWRLLRAQRIDLAERTSWCVSTDLEFAANAADIVGLYLDPRPTRSCWRSMKSRQSTRSSVPKATSNCLTAGRSPACAHEYKWRGTTTLFAALEFATGATKAKHYHRRRRVEFLDFINQVVACYPDQEIHVILGNLNTYKPKRDQWLARHKNVRFHFTPIHASWLNQVEIWFSILARSALNGGFTSVAYQRAAIDAINQAHNTNAAPFQWRKGARQYGSRTYDREY